MNDAFMSLKVIFFIICQKMKINNNFLMLIIFCIPIIMQAQENNTKSAREGFKLVLAVDEKTSYESEIEPSPFITGQNILQLYPGEDIFLEIDQKDGIILNMRVVKKNVNLDKTLEISFKQDIDKNQHKAMILQIKNPFKMTLKYSAKMLLLKDSKWVDTDVMPVREKLSSFETWPDIIISLALDDWKFNKE